jgi:hypothetical protein
MVVSLKSISSSGFLIGVLFVAFVISGIGYALFWHQVQPYRIGVLLSESGDNSFDFYQTLGLLMD